jgi:LexA-binding, inner membrane-associated putative hydrolase
MSPETHLLASWLIAAKTTDNPRDCRLVTLAGILPDADGLGLLADIFNSTFRHKQTFYYSQFHHWYLHGLFGALVISALLTCFARRRFRVALLALIVFHLHLLCDLAGSRGPSLVDLWPVCYFGPFSARHGVWLWRGQWRLDGWINRIITVVLFLWTLWLGSKRDDSVVGVFNRRLDATFVQVLHKWRQAWLDRYQLGKSESL